VVLKTLTDRGGGDADRSVAASLDRLLSDPWLTVIVVLAAAVVVAARRGAVRAAVFPAVVALVAVVAHVVAGSVSYDLRYQTYLYGLGTLVLLRTVPAVPLRALAPRWRPYAPAALVLVVVPAGVYSVRNTVTVPGDAEPLALLSAIVPVLSFRVRLACLTGWVGAWMDSAQTCRVGL
jgi:hypothetical protein